MASMLLDLSRNHMRKEKKKNSHHKPHRKILSTAVIGVLAPYNHYHRRAFGLFRLTKPCNCLVPQVVVQNRLVPQIVVQKRPGPSDRGTKPNSHHSTEYKTASRSLVADQMLVSMFKACCAPCSYKKDHTDRVLFLPISHYLLFHTQPPPSSCSPITSHTCVSFPATYYTLFHFFFFQTCL